MTKRPADDQRLNLDRLHQLLGQFSRLTIGLVGDLFLDRYLEIDPQLEELSIETGLAAHQVVRVRNAGGALGTVLNNLAALGVGRLVPVTVIGDDGHGDDLLRAIRDLPVVTDHILRRSERLTPTYTKPLKIIPGQPPQELNRLDVRSRQPLTSDAQQSLQRQLQQVFPACDGWIVLDQVPEPEWGVVNPATRQLLASLCQRYPRQLLLVDSRMRLGEFSFGMLKGNRQEFLRAAHIEDDQSGQAVILAARQLAKRTGQSAFCTVGEAGMVVASAEGSVYRVTGVPVDGPIDIVGAGDAATSGIVASLLSGATPLESAAVGNLVASITIQQLGTTGVATPEQLLNRLQTAGPPNIMAC